MKKSQSSDYMIRLEKTLAIDDVGNATFAKSVLADGTIGGNSGLKPIHQYDFISGEKLIILDERVSLGDGGFAGFGYIDDNEGTLYPALFNYNLDNGKVAGFYGVADGMIFELTTDNLLADHFATLDKTQSKLYNHTLTLTAGTNNYVLMYDCSNNTPAKSIQDLRSLMNISSSSDSVILPVVNPTDLSTAGLQVTTSLCKIGTANVTALSDKLTEKN